jgi:hypothetical protein
MTATQYVRIRCDEDEPKAPNGRCDVYVEVQAADLDVARRQLKTAGWGKDNGFDICPSHQWARERKAIRT